MISAKRSVRPLVLLFTVLAISFGTMVAIPSTASAASAPFSGSLTTAQPTYTHMKDPCVGGNQTTRYRVIEARIIGVPASTLTATVTPQGFRANLGVYDGYFMPEMPIVNCMGNPSGASSDAPVTYSIPTPQLLPGFTERSYLFVIAGETPADLGSFTLNVTSTNATEVILKDVTDITPPELSGGGSKTVEADGPAGTVATFNVTAMDNLDGARPVTCDPASGSTFVIGKTKVTCTASDLSDNTGTKTFTVTVKDTKVPVLTLPGTITQAATSGDGARVTYSASAVDVVDGAVAPVCTPASGDVFAIGTTTVTCTATDAAGNAGSGTFDVKVTTGTMELAGSLMISGTAKVGSTLSVTTSLTTSPAASKVTGQWFRDDEAIADQTGDSYELVAADFGKTITFKQTFELAGFNDATATSNAVGEVVAGDIAVERPVISGDARVGDTLRVLPVVSAPSDAVQSFAWFVGGAQVSTDAAYTLQAADLGQKIHVTVTATKSGHVAQSADSVLTDAVVPGKMTASGQVQVTGTPRVGDPLSAVSTVETAPLASGKTGQWFRGNTPIEDATSPSYTPANADAGLTLRYVETSTRLGYEPVVAESSATSIVTGGVMAPGAVLVVGDLTVDQTLTASLPDLRPADADLSYSWQVDGKQVGTSATYLVKPADVGHPVALTITATKAGFNDVMVSWAVVDAVEAAAFGTSPKVAFTGMLMVGETLTAVSASASPAPDSVSYQWSADGEPIDDATGKTYVLTADEQNKAVRVKVTATRAGYVDASGVSPASAAVASKRAPRVALKSSATKLRLGQSTSLSWTTDYSATVRASGAWTGTKAALGKQTVKPSAAGTSTYILTATNAAGTTTVQVVVPVALPAKKLGLSAASSVRQGKKLTIKATGLVKGEKYSIKLGTKTIASGKADSAGRINRSVKIPSSSKKGTQTLKVTGSLSDRTASKKVKVTGK